MSSARLTRRLQAAPAWLFAVYAVAAAFTAYLCAYALRKPLAAARFTGTAVFGLYVADALGYCGSIAVQLGKDLLADDLSRFEFFRAWTYGMAAAGTAAVAASAAWLGRELKPAEAHSNV